MIPIEGPAHSTNLTDGCWDCECETDYIHARIRESKCEKCGVTEEDGPDSHAHEAAEIESLRMTAKESMEYVGMCPFCHHSEVDEDGDGECTCEACGKGWKTERRIVGYSWTDEPEGRIKAIEAIEQERDRLRAEVEHMKAAPVVVPELTEGEAFEEAERTALALEDDPYLYASGIEHGYRLAASRLRTIGPGEVVS